MEANKTNNFKADARHKRYGLEIELSDDLEEVRYKGVSDSEPSKWQKIKIDNKGLQYFIIHSERFYLLWDFESVNS